MQLRSLQKKFGKKLVTGLSLCLSVFLLCGMNASAAGKETPLVNLAKGLTSVTDSTGKSLTDVQLLTDGDKYYLQHNADGNKVAGSSVHGHQSNNGWEAYVEQGAKVAEGAEWIQMDLGASYPIEVINLKRRVYDGVGSTATTTGLGGSQFQYTDTVIVIGNEADLSDGYVVYYNDDDESVTLPAGVEKPGTTATGGLAPQMAGNYFYMDNTIENGAGYTELGTTRTARYIRVYSDNPDADEELMLMELGVYGYRSEDKIQGAREKKVVNNENPLMIAAAYSDDQWYLGQEGQVILQGYNTIPGRWNTIANDLKDNTVLMMHSNNLRSFSPHYIGQAYIHGYYEACLEEAFQAGANTMLQLINASSYPGGTTWCITRDVDYHWVDLMFRMYPNLESVFSTENFWSGQIDGVANSVAKYLEIVNRYGGYVVYSEEGTGIFNTLANQPALREAVEKYGDTLYYTYKNTAGGNDCLLTQSHIMGSWLAGYTGGWGMLSDSWAWANNGNGHYYEGLNGAQGWQGLCTEPETIFGMQMLNTYLNGGVVYTFEFPEVVYGAIDTKSPAYAHVVERVFRYICDNPGPSRADMLNNTKTILYGAVPQTLYGVTAGTDNVLGILQTGRYGAIPSIPSWGTQAEVTQNLKETAKKEGASAPVVLSNGDGVLSVGAKTYFDKLYQDVEYAGTAFAQLYDNRWHIYNSTKNSDVDQYAVLPLEAGEGTARFRAFVEPHTFATVEEKDDSIEISLNNYRINAKNLIYTNPNGWIWTGSSATGQGVSRAKLSVYRYMAYYNCVNASTVPYIDEDTTFVNSKYPDGKPETIQQLSPNDNELRTTTFVVSTLSEAPTVEVVDAQKPDTDGQAQYTAPVVTFDETTGKATITVETNGWVELKVSNLQYAEDESVPSIEEAPEEVFPGQEDEPEPLELENAALSKTVTGSHNASSGKPFTVVTNGNTGDGDSEYTDWNDTRGPVWAQVDLGEVRDIAEVQMWRYYRDGRYYNDTVIMLSESGDFTDKDNTLVIWNANELAGTEWLTENGGSETHTLPVGSDSTYAETSAGKSFPVYGDNVCWQNESKEGVPTAEDRTFAARYVRVYMNGANGTRGSSSHLKELKVMAVVKPAEGGGEGGDDTETITNLASRASVSVSTATSGDRPASWAINGDKEANNFTDPGRAVEVNNNGEQGAQWIQLDLGIQQDVESVALWRYHADGRKYYNTVVLLSSDKNFTPETTLVLWNADSNASGRNETKVATWPGNGNGQTGTHTLPEGTDPTYGETSAGKTFMVNADNVKWLDGTDRALPGERYKARYVRVYMNGNQHNGSNHVVEIEVNGIEGEFVLEDTDAPEQVTGIELLGRTTTSAVLRFLPAMDNMGLKEYEMTVRKGGAEGEVVQELKLSQTMYEITGLEADTEYTISIVAVDYFDNKSEPSVYTLVTPDEKGYLVEASVPSGIYAEAQTVILSSKAGYDYGDIYYTLDGTEPFDEDGNPSASAKKYTEGEEIAVSESMVIKAALKGEQVYVTCGFFYQIDADVFHFTVPSAPTDVTVTEVSANSARISWSSGSDPDIKEFCVYINGEKKTSVNVNARAASDIVIDGLEAGTAYQVYVTAVDNAENESLRSRTVEFVTRLETNIQQ